MSQADDRGRRIGHGDGEAQQLQDAPADMSQVVGQGCIEALVGGQVVLVAYKPK